MNLEKKRLNISQKIEIVQYAQANPKETHVFIAAKFAKKFGFKHITKQTMSRLFNPQYIKKLLHSDDADSTFKNLKECHHPELERCLFIWFNQAQSDIIINDKMLMEKAQEFGQMLESWREVSKGEISEWFKKFEYTPMEYIDIDSQEPINDNFTDCEIFEMVTSIENLEDVDDSEKEKEDTVRDVSNKEAIVCYEKLFSYFETHSSDSESYENFYLKLKKSRISNNETKLSRLIFSFPKRVSIIENSLNFFIKNED
ncbi:hypothetical protein BpHYR1_004481 [Brachionus plicatilis]|uniref:Uncharacterized protein n=1 Tax=Brachionus plicatilis TaxID=10195 RepID=A0A3M7S9M6_BRAPC|nr:hypothetical protein BpHYR1_004481 [Brachionus plicatilis]